MAGANTQSPLDRIRSWENIHGLNEYLLDHYSKINEETCFGGRTSRNNPLFSKDRYVDLMIFRENYIKKLHAILKEKLEGCNILIHILPKMNTIYSKSKTVENFIRNLNGESLYTNGIRIHVICRGYHSFDIENVADNASIGKVLNRVTPDDIKQAVFDGLKEMKSDASKKILPILLEHHYRPPEDGAGGGTGYSRIKTSVKGFDKSRKGRKGRKSRKSRKTN